MDRNGLQQSLIFCEKTASLVALCNYEVKLKLFLKHIHSTFYEFQPLKITSSFDKC